MPLCEAPSVDLGSAPQSPSVGPSPSPSEISSTSSPEPRNIQPTPLFRILAMRPPEPPQPEGQEELERRLPGYRRIVIPRELTLIELLKQCSGVATDDEVLHIREARLRVMADRIGLRRLHVLAPCLRSLTLDGSAIGSLRDLGIGLVHLRILSVNRCGLTSLDGIWGLSSLRELHAAYNRLQDLQPLAALQKMHTLNLGHNPIADSSRLWMLAVCGALKKLTLEGCPASDAPDYRNSVASALPLLNSLDDHPLHNDISDEIYGLEDLSSSESEAEDVPPPAQDQKPPADLEPQPSTSKEEQYQVSDDENIEEFEAKVVNATALPKLHQRRRPATTESAGLRPRYQLPARPKTAHARPPLEAPTKLEFLNTLMDEEWRCSGSKLTSHGAVCGNLARALRRPGSAKKARERAAHETRVSAGIELVSRELALEIPRAPELGDWERFKKETGIDIDIDFTQPLYSGDAAQAIERLERIEKETAQRLDHPDSFREDFDVKDRESFCPVNHELWNMENIDVMLHGPTRDAVYRPIAEFASEVDDMFACVSLDSSPEESLPD